MQSNMGAGAELRFSCVVERWSFFAMEGERNVQVLSFAEEAAQAEGTESQSPGSAMHAQGAFFPWI